jgi:phenylacetate-CoA ligase
MYSFLSRKAIYPLYGLVSDHRILPNLAQMEESQWWSTDVLAAWQNARLSQLLRHAYDTVPYYRRVFDVAGLEPGGDHTVDDLRHLPLLTKSSIRDYQEELISTAYPPRKRIANHTGGSTGTPLHFYQDRRQRSWSSANKLRCNRWAGWEFGKHTLRLWGHPRELKAAKRARGQLRSLLLREHTFDAFYFSVEDMADLTDYIRRKSPQIVVAYASMLTHFAAYLDERGVTDLPPPDGIITSTDMLFPDQRDLIERVFQTEVYDRYGCREVSVIAAECGEHHGMHVSADRLIVEFTDGVGDPVSPGQPGHVVITDLFNYAMPFIRYDIEDVAIPSSEPCRCGRGLPLINQLAGRLADILTTPEGQFVSASALTTILPKIRGLGESQLVQKAPDWLQVNVVRRPNYDETSEATFVRHLSTYFGPRMRITFNYVEEIPRTASGKKRFSISEIGRDRCG